jgi:hypothetical protein
MRAIRAAPGCKLPGWVAASEREAAGWATAGERP